MGLYGLSTSNYDKMQHKQNDSKISATQPTNTSSDDGKHLINAGAQPPLFKLYLSQHGQDPAPGSADPTATTTANYTYKPNEVYQDSHHAVETSSSNAATSSDPLTTRNRLKLSSARHARPPKGVIGSASNKMLEASVRNGSCPGGPDGLLAATTYSKAEKRAGPGLSSYASVNSGAADSVGE